MPKLIAVLTFLFEFPAFSQTTFLKWNADSLTGQIPAGRHCSSITAPTDGSAVFDTADKVEGTASMRLIFNNTWAPSAWSAHQGNSGCQDWGNTTISNSWYGGEWVCFNWAMKLDTGFNWDYNWSGGQDLTCNTTDTGCHQERTMKQVRFLNGSPTTIYETIHWDADGFNIRECNTGGGPGCTPCPSYPGGFGTDGADGCLPTPYDFRPSTNPAVAQWQQYTYGIKKQSAQGVANGGTALWVNGVKVSHSDNAIWYTGPANLPLLLPSGGTNMMGGTSYPQTPVGKYWIDDVEGTIGSAECVPRSPGTIQNCKNNSCELEIVGKN